MLKCVAWAAALAGGLVVAACSTDDGSPGAPADAASPASRATDAGDSRSTFEAGLESDAGGPPSSPDAAPCVEQNDPGGSENVATVLPPTDDCDNDLKTVNGIMQSVTDVDMYKLSGTDKTFCLFNTEFESKTEGTELCVFLRCKDSTVDAVTGCAQGTEATSDIGLKGCCTSGPGHAIPSWSCAAFLDDSADILLRVKADGAAQCLPYQFTYRF